MNLEDQYTTDNIASMLWHTGPNFKQDVLELNKLYSYPFRLEIPMTSQHCQTFIQLYVAAYPPRFLDTQINSV